MNPLADNPPQQDPPTLGTRLGSLAAQNATSFAVPSRLSTILQHLRDRAQVRERADAQFRAALFILAD